MASNHTKQHRMCIRESRDKVAETSNRCFAEAPIFRNGKWHYLDLECHPTNPNFKPCAIECENKSPKRQRISNYYDLLKWKQKNPHGEIFQVESADQINLNKLRKNLQFQRTLIPKFSRKGHLRRVVYDKL